MGTGYSRNAARAGWRESWPSTGRAFTAPAAQRAGSRSNAPHGKRPIATAAKCSVRRETADRCPERRDCLSPMLRLTDVVTYALKPSLAGIAKRHPNA